MQVKFIVVIMAYFLLNIAYSFRLKEVILLDVFLIAGGFMLRVFGGAYAISVQVSSWIVLCSTFISLFLGFAKRRGELVNVEGAESGAPRRVLLLYRVEFLDQMLTISAAGAVIAYALCTVAPRTVATFGTENLIYTTIFVIYGVFRHLYLIHSGKQGENPTNALTSDVPMIVNGVLWVLSCVYLIYIGGGATWLPRYDAECLSSLLRSPTAYLFNGTPLPFNVFCESGIPSGVCFQCPFQTAWEGADGEKCRKIQQKLR